MRGIPPILIETAITEVNFQTEHLGWQTDDFLIVCERADGASQKLAGQVKRSFTISAADADCTRAIQDFWNDFKSSGRFSSLRDRLVLVTLRGTDTLLKHFVALLDCARAARNGVEFEHRLATKGFISETAVRHCGELRQIISSAEDRPITAADLWPFLRVLHVLSLDLDTSTRQTEAQVKSLLAYTATEGDAVGEANTSWNALLGIASTAMSEARTLSRSDLPLALQQRHASISLNEQRVLRALKDHAEPILRGIRSTIGQDFHLQRAALVQKVLVELETTRVVLVSGAAGSGKSAIGKDAVSLLCHDYFAFAFRAEEFAQPHFDATLHAGQITASWIQLSAILAAQDRKLMLVESVERLLEKTTRDAFSDLMTLVADDPTMCVILTCRDYSTELVRASFLQPRAITYAVVSVPPLDDAELMEVEAALPALACPLQSRALRNILRNPYFLDKALEISWSAERPLPDSERDFRALFWRDIVRAEHRVQGGMARRREQVFQDIAVRRARALSAYVICNDLDPAVIEALRHDSLVESPRDNPSRIATAHDVLEDWAILQWLEEQHLTGEGSFKDLSAAIGTHPAIRRAYRKWVAELVDRDSAAADRVFAAAITDTEISTQFRDDTLVSLLKAPSSPDFLARHEPELMASDKALLKRAIHLLRVACVTAPTWLPAAVARGSVFNVPDGTSWAPVLRLVHDNIDGFTPQEYALLLALIEDAVRGVSWWAPQLDGEEFVAGIGHWLLAHFDNYGSDELRKRVLRVIAKIPKADAVRFEIVLRGVERDGQRRDYIAEDFREILFAGVEGMPAARDLPSVVLSVGKDYLLASEQYLRSDIHWGSALDLETHFGIKSGLTHDFFPASALRGPWIPLLRHHFREAMDFFIEIFNHSIDWYVRPRVQDPLEPAWEIEVTFADGTTRKHWGNPRLWNLYRGTSVGPYVLQSILMSLEKWLLEFAVNYPEQLDAVLLDVLSRTDSAALVGVVASIATAHRHAAAETLLVLLSAPDYIALDRGRMAGESQASALPGIFSQLGRENEIYEAERRGANRLPHRGTDLEIAITNLQLGALAPRVHGILDRHIAALPSKPEQDKSDLIWRLALHRMDLRQYTMSDSSVPENLDLETDAGETAKRYVRLDPKALDPDVQAMVDESAAEYVAMNARLGVLLWGVQTLGRENGKYDPSLWREKLEEARTMDRDTDRPDGSRHGPGFIAAVCARDHWNEMSTEQQDWCTDVVCAEILRECDSWDRFERGQLLSMSADRAAASVVSLLLNKPLTDARKLTVRTAFAAAITHPIDEVRWSAIWSIDEQFWAADRATAMLCVNAIATEATLIDQARAVEKTRPYEEQRQFNETTAAAAREVRQRFWQDAAIAEDAHSTVDISKGFGAEASAQMLAMLGQVPTDSVAIAAFARASKTLVDWWDAGEDRKHRRERNYHTEAAISERLRQFLMRTSSATAQTVLGTVLSAIDRHPREIHSIVEGLTVIEASRPNTAQYWFLWGLFAEGVQRAKWVSRLHNEHPTGSELLAAIFLTSGWKNNVRHWRSLEGNAHHVHALFESLPPTSIVLDDYLRFLYHIGERSLPDAFVRVANSLKVGEVQKMLRRSNTVYLLEILLQQHVYGRPLELKRDTSVRQAVLFLLDALVESGSSAAFRMRDDFVTPSVE